MDQVTERQLMRWLHGELPPAEAAALERRLEADPELADRARRLREVWGSLEPPPESPVPAGFTTRVMTAVASSGSSSPGWAALRPQWAAALALGLSLGIGAGWTIPVAPSSGVSPGVSMEGSLARWEPPPSAVKGPPLERGLEEDMEDAWTWPEPAGSLADEYWQALHELHGQEASDGEEL